MSDWYGWDTMRQIQKRLENRVKAACIYLTGEVKQVISVPAPRKRVQVNTLFRSRTVSVTFNPATVTATPMMASRKTIMYVATTRATPLAPPRKLSGNLRRHIMWEVRTVADEVIGRVGSNVHYARRLEMDPKHPHKYLVPTLMSRLTQINAILKG